MQRIGGSDALIRVQMEPSLPPVSDGTTVPGDPERLIATARELYQILLQRLDAERIGDFVCFEHTRRTLRLDEEGAVPVGELRNNSKVLEACVVEVPENRGLGRLLHREVVV